MPRFLDSSNPALNTLVRAKKKVVKRNIEKYTSVEPDTAKIVTATPATKPADQLADAFKNKLNAIVAGLQTISSFVFLKNPEIMSLPRGRKKTEPSAGDLGLVVTEQSTRLTLAVRDARDFFYKKLKRNFNMFDPQTEQEIVELILEIQDLQGRVDGVLERYSDRVSEEVTELLESTYGNSLDDLIAELEDAVASYKFGVPSSLPRDTTAEGAFIPDDVSTASSSTGRGISGGVALRVGMDFANPFTGWSPEPPRNRQDLEHLPRRFL